MKSIIELAIVTQLIDHRDTEESLPADFVQSLREFATAIRAHALEEAAKVCDARATKNELACHDADEDEATSLRSAAWQISVCASAIRALKGQP